MLDPRRHGPHGATLEAGGLPPKLTQQACRLPFLRPPDAHFNDRERDKPAVNLPRRQHLVRGKTGLRGRDGSAGL